MNPLVEINREIMATLIELLKQGGPLALWAFSIWLIIGLIKITLVCLTIYLVVRLVANTLTTVHKINKETTAQRIHLLSSQVADKLTSTLETFSKESLHAVNELKTQLTELKQKLNEKSK